MPVNDPELGAICIPVHDPGEDGDEDPGTETTGTAMCTYQGQKIPCVTEDGVWFASHQCYAQPADPQPAPEDAVWAGHDPSKGKMWFCTEYAGPGTGGNWFYVSDGRTPDLIDPGDVARNALEQMPLEVPVVHLAPAPPLKTYVHLETWLWMRPGQFHKVVMTVTAGDTSVRVEAAPLRVEWDMGDGQFETCLSGGRPWVIGMPDSVETSCSHVYDHTSQESVDGRFKVTAVIVYQVDWTCTGSCTSGAGTLGEVPGMAGESAIVVGERQSVVTG